MAVHFTENKANASVSAIKTPFLIEDILDRNSIKSGQKINFNKVRTENINSPNTRNGGGESSVNCQNEKHMRNNNEIPSNDEDYRKLLQSERYAKLEFNSRCVFEPSARLKLYRLLFRVFVCKGKT